MGLLERRAACSVLFSGRGATARSSSSHSSINAHRVPTNTLGFVFCPVGHKSIILWVNSLPLPPLSRKIPSISSILPVSLWGSSFLLMSMVSAPHSKVLLSHHKQWITSNTINSMLLDSDQINWNPSVHELLHTSTLAHAHGAQHSMKCHKRYKCRQTLAESFFVVNPECRFIQHYWRQCYLSK